MSKPRCSIHDINLWSKTNLLCFNSLISRAFNIVIIDFVCSINDSTYSIVVVMPHFQLDLKNGRDIPTALAPNARLLTTSRGVRTPPLAKTLSES